MPPLPHTKCSRTYKKLGCFGATSKPLNELLITDRDLKSPKSDGHKLNWKEWEESIHRFEVFYCLTIVNRGDWLGSPENIKGANKNAKIYVGRSTTLHNLLFCAHTLCMNYVANTFLLASSSVRSKQLLCFVQGQGQKSEQKHTTKSIDEFHNHSPLLTMVSPLYVTALED